MVKRAHSKEKSAAFECELARRRAELHLLDAASILNQAIPYIELDQRPVYIEIIRAINAIGNRLADLEPKARAHRMAKIILTATKPQPKDDPGGSQ
jgi:hypothetical protein